MSCQSVNINMSANVEGTKKLVKVSQYKNRHVERFTDLDKRKFVYGGLVLGRALRSVIIILL